MSKKNGVVFVCRNCGNEFNKWQGQCTACNEWNSLQEITNHKFQITNHVKRGYGKLQKSKRQNIEVVNLSSIEGNFDKNKIIFSSKILEFDRVLGKGLVQGSVLLFSGEPGVGKSTLLTQLVGKIGGLYVAGEESVEQISLRVDRLRLKRKGFDILQTNDLEDIVEYLNRVEKLPRILVVDSIQVLVSSELSSVAGSITQIKECAFRLIELAKTKGVTVVIVGHVTKGGNIAGPKLLEHMVDVVLYFEGEKNGELRFLRSVKNRFGSTNEVGVFKMNKNGLQEIRGKNLKLLERDGVSVGSALTILIEGKRPILVEIQALVTESFSQIPKRVFLGIDYNRGQLLMAVAQKNLGIPFYKYDVFVSVTGGMKIKETVADLAVVATMYSSYINKELRMGNSDKLVFLGEVSLLGEVKKIREMAKREREIKAWGVKLAEVKSVRDLKKFVIQ